MCNIVYILVYTGCNIVYILVYTGCNIVYILVYIDVLILCIYKDLQEYSLNTNRHIISERASEVRKIIINSIKSMYTQL